jgi:hypothetical protein
MDIGPVTRELAPLKYKRAPNEKLKCKTKVKVKPIPPGSENQVDMDDYLFGTNYFHHLVGLSSIRKSKILFE